MAQSANGRHTTNGRPHIATSLTPHIVVENAEAAIVFYRDVLGARIGAVTRFGATIAHAVLHFDAGMLTLSDPMPVNGLAAPDPNRTTYSMALYVCDVDETAAKAVAAGARLVEPPATFVNGDRFAVIVDPFGVRWPLMTRVEDLSPEESAARVAEWAKSRSPG